MFRTWVRGHVSQGYILNVTVLQIIFAYTNVLVEQSIFSNLDWLKIPITLYQAFVVIGLN